MNSQFRPLVFCMNLGEYVLDMDKNLRRFVKTSRANIMIKRSIKYFAIIFFLYGQSGCVANSADNDSTGDSSTGEKSFSLTDNQITIYSSLVTDTLDLLILSDTHLFMKDDREIPYDLYSNRMAAAYNITKHFLTGDETTPSRAFEETIAIATRWM